MSLIEIIKNKYLPIFRNDQFRITLTIIGITVAGVIFLLGSMVVDSIRYNMYKIIDELPSDVIIHQNVSDSHYNYLRRIDDNEKLIPFESTELVKYEYINKEKYSIQLRVIGTHNDFVSSCVPYQNNFPTSQINSLQGRVWTVKESEQKLNVMVITNFASKIFFGDTNPLGKKLFIPSYGVFIVIGVVNNLKEYEDSYDTLSNQDSLIETPLAHLFIPLSTYKHYKFDYIEGSTTTLIQQHEEAELVKSALAKSDYGDVFSKSYTRTSVSDDFEENLKVYKAIFTIVFVVVFVFSFIIIVNTMIFSIKGRINEIGIRVSLGASKKNVLFQFIFEALILAFLAMLLSLVILYFVIQMFNVGIIEDFVFTISLSSIIKYIIGFIITVLLASLIPAYYASSINIIDTLRLD
jgi:putative ABC transport system permease protein